MKLKIFQKGFNYSQDGRGNRLIFHLQGCNMHCPWCANPEGMPLQGALFVEKEWLRESCCPKGAVKDGSLDRGMCHSCDDMPCIHQMRQKGIRLSYQEIEVEELVEECKKSRPMFFDGGGVTITGGEITMQFDAVKEFLARLGEEGIHRAIESNGSHPKMEELLPLVDEWIMDVKHYDSTKHKEWLGIPNTGILANMEMAVNRHSDVLLRIPLMPGFNNAPEDVNGFLKVFAICAGKENVRVEFLTYHEFGKGKWEQCGRVYPMKPGKILPETLKLYTESFKNTGINVVHT